MLAVIAATAVLSIATSGPLPAQPHVDVASANLELKGRATTFAAVELRAGCVLGPCTSSVVAGRRGRWKATLNVVMPLGQRSIRVRVASGLQVASKRFALTYPAYAATPPYANRARAPQLAVIGDSLAVGADTPLRAQLQGWKVTTDGRVGRPLSEGMTVLDRTPLPRRQPLALAFSLFSNDDPTHYADLVEAVEASVERLGPRDCAIWATIARPKVGGVTYDQANATLEALAAQHPGELQLVDWAAAVRRHPGWMSRDRVHPTDSGYVQRARLFADAARACQAEQGW